MCSPTLVRCIKERLCNHFKWLLKIRPGPCTTSPSALNQRLLSTHQAHLHTFHTRTERQRLLHGLRRISIAESKTYSACLLHPREETLGPSLSLYGRKNSSPLPCCLPQRSLVPSLSHSVPHRNEGHQHVSHVVAVGGTHLSRNDSKPSQPRKAEPASARPTHVREVLEAIVWSLRQPTNRFVHAHVVTLSARLLVPIPILMTDRRAEMVSNWSHLHLQTHPRMQQLLPLPLHLVG